MFWDPRHERKTHIELRGHGSAGHCHSALAHSESDDWPVHTRFIGKLKLWHRYTFCPPPPGRPVHSDTNSASPGSILAMQQLHANTKSLTGARSTGRWAGWNTLPVKVHDATLRPLLNIMDYASLNPVRCQPSSWGHCAQPAVPYHNIMDWPAVFFSTAAVA